MSRQTSLQFPALATHLFRIALPLSIYLPNRFSLDYKTNRIRGRGKWLSW